MTSAHAADGVLLASLVKRLTEELPSSIRQIISTLEEDELWWRPCLACNSIGNLVIHVSGGLREYVISGVGRQPIQRNREAEFDPLARCSKVDLLKTFDGTIEEVAGVIAEADFTDPTTCSRVLSSAQHLAHHVGQMQYLAGMMFRSKVRP